MNGIAWMIVFCEIAFWVVIVLGLAVRYVFKRHTLGLLFLGLTPVIDLILLAATGVDLYRRPQRPQPMGLQLFTSVYRSLMENK